MSANMLTVEHSAYQLLDIPHADSCTFRKQSFLEVGKKRPTTRRILRLARHLQAQAHGSKQILGDQDALAACGPVRMGEAPHADVPQG